MLLALGPCSLVRQEATDGWTKDRGREGCAGMLDGAGEGLARRGGSGGGATGSTRGRCTRGSSPSPTRAFYLVIGTRRDDDVDRSRRPGLVRSTPWLVIVDTRRERVRVRARSSPREAPPREEGSPRHGGGRGGRGGRASKRGPRHQQLSGAHRGRSNAVAACRSRRRRRDRGQAGSRSRGGGRRARRTFPRERDAVLDGVGVRRAARGPGERACAFGDGRRRSARCCYPCPRAGAGLTDHGRGLGERRVAASRPCARSACTCSAWPAHVSERRSCAPCARGGCWGAERRTDEGRAGCASGSAAATQLGSASGRHQMAESQPFSPCESAATVTLQPFSRTDSGRTAAHRPSPASESAETPAIQPFSGSESGRTAT